jgi:hypothetical protein
MAPGIAAVAKLAPFAKLGPFSEQQLQQLGALQAQLLRPSATAAAPRTSPTPPAAAIAAHAAAPVAASAAAPEMALGGNSHSAGKLGLPTPASPMHKQQQQHASSDDGDGTNTAAETSPESDRGHLLPATGVAPGV